MLCPGTIVIGILFAFINCVWYALWYGAFLQCTAWLTANHGGTIPWGSWVGMLCTAQMVDLGTLYHALWRYGVAWNLILTRPDST